jgi:hypothetical protein
MLEEEERDNRRRCFCEDTESCLVGELHRTGDGGNGDDEARLEEK